MHNIQRQYDAKDRIAGGSMMCMPACGLGRGDHGGSVFAKKGEQARGGGSMILALSKGNDSSTGASVTPTTALKQLFSGGVAGALAKTVTAPLSRLVILFQVHSLVSTKGSAAPKFANSTLDGAKKVVEREGVFAFWKGNGTSVLHRFPYSAINFYVYEKVSRVVFWYSRGGGGYIVKRPRSIINPQCRAIHPSCSFLCPRQFLKLCREKKLLFFCG